MNADAIARCDLELAAIAESTGDPWGLLMGECDFRVEKQLLEEMQESLSKNADGRGNDQDRGKGEYDEDGLPDDGSNEVHKVRLPGLTAGLGSGVNRTPNDNTAFLLPKL